MIIQFVSSILVLLLLIKILYKLIHVDTKQNIGVIPPYVPPFYKLEKDVKIEEEEQPLTGTILHSSGDIDSVFHKLFKYIHTDTIGIENEKWATLIDNDSMLNPRVSEKEFLYVIRYLIHLLDESDEPTVINLYTKSKTDVHYNPIEKFHYRVDMVKKQSLKPPYIINKSGWNTESREIKCVTVEVNTTDDIPIMYNNNDLFYKNIGLLCSKDNKGINNNVVVNLIDKIFFN